MVRCPCDFFNSVPCAFGLALLGFYRPLRSIRGYPEHISQRRCFPIRPFSKKLGEKFQPLNPC